MATSASLDEEQDWSQVVSADAEFRAEANSKPFIHVEEAGALARLFSSAELCAVCKEGLGDQRWGDTLAKWATWQPAGSEAQAKAVEGVVAALDAVHLRPTGILERLEQGVAAACFGLATLLQHMPARPADGGGSTVSDEDLAAASGPEADAAWAALVAQHPHATVLDDSIIALPAEGGESAPDEPEPEPEPAVAVDAGSRANAVGGVAASVASAGEDGAAAAAALEYADYLNSQRDHGWKD